MMLMTMIIIIIIIIISALLPVLSCAVDPTLTGWLSRMYLFATYVRSLGDYDVRPLIGTGSVWRWRAVQGWSCDESVWNSNHWH